MDVISMLRMMSEKKASDLYITAGLPPSMRINGRIEAVSPDPLTPAETSEMVLGMMSPSQREDFNATRRS
jgi:twitching motility protein PilU